MSKNKFRNEKRENVTLRLKPRFPLSVMPDANGRYPEALARRLIRGRLAVEILDRDDLT